MKKATALAVAFLLGQQRRAMASDGVAGVCTARCLVLCEGVITLSLMEYVQATAHFQAAIC